LKLDRLKHSATGETPARVIHAAIIRSGCDCIPAVR
jgi:hypothetical protein